MGGWGGGDTPMHTMIDVWQGSKYVSGGIFLQVFDLILLICWNKMFSPIFIPSTGIWTTKGR